nr:hypothetical protein Iba_chr10fCG5720 [Ipomoea batatas]
MGPALSMTTLRSSHESIFPHCVLVGIRKYFLSFGVHNLIDKILSEVNRTALVKISICELQEFSYRNSLEVDSHGILLNSSENKDYHLRSDWCHSSHQDRHYNKTSQCAQAVAPDKDAGGSNVRDRGGCEEGQARQPRHLI